jgi:hypothetical protein
LEWKALYKNLFQPLKIFSLIERYKEGGKVADDVLKRAIKNNAIKLWNQCTVLSHKAMVTLPVPKGGTPLI